MNNLQKLIKLRGLTIQEISSEIGQGYHITQKVIKGTRYKRKDGSFGTYSSRPVEDGVAQLLGLARSEVWGEKAHITLRRLIKQEIKSQAKQLEQDMHQNWLLNSNIPKKNIGGNV